MYNPFKPKTSFKKWFRLGLIVVLIFFVMGLFVIWQFAVPASGSPELKHLSVTSGQSVKEIGRNMKDIGLIRSQWWFETWVWLTGLEKKFVAGEYNLPSNANIINLTTMLSGGIKPTNELKVTLIEGWSNADVVKYLDKSDFNASDSFTAALINKELLNTIVATYPESLKKAILSAPNLEGYMFPDTYRVRRNKLATDLLKKSLDNFYDKFQDEWFDTLRAKNRSVSEAVVMASIIEKEVRTDPDRALVSDIFWRRIQKGMPLQADSTVNYVTGKSTPSASYDDVQIDSKYNTYKNKGLPPGPICNPGYAALRAAVNPAANDYWYFLTTPEGKIIYSKTFNEHVANKVKYLK